MRRMTFKYRLKDRAEKEMRISLRNQKQAFFGSIQKICDFIEAYGNKFLKFQG
jgi:hypothetical protein